MIPFVRVFTPALSLSLKTPGNTHRDIVAKRGGTGRLEPRLSDVAAHWPCRAVQGHGCGGNQHARGENRDVSSTKATLTELC